MSESIIKFWPGSGLVYSATRKQYEGPCPFCNPASADGAPILEGDDRFIAKSDMPGGYCRQCGAAGRGSRGNGWYSDGQIAARFGEELDENYTAPTPQAKVEKPLSYKYDDFRDESHSRVDYTFWLEKYNWSQDIVDDWRLGYGTLYDRNPNQHLIPMRVGRYGRQVYPGWYYASRGNGKERLPGSSKPYMGFVEKDPTHKVAVITEGDTDPVSATAIGYLNVFTVFGNFAWTDDKADFLLERGYEQFIILGDRDDAGQQLVENIIDSFHKRDITNLRFLVWSGEESAKDITDLLKTQNRADARSWIEARLREPQRRIQQIQHNTKERIKQELIFPLDELRGEGQNSILGQIRLFVNTYDVLNISAGTALHLEAPPGAGKTHALIRVAEELARDRLLSASNEREYLEQKITELQAQLTIEVDEEVVEELRKTRNRLKNHGNTAVAWYGQYKHGWEDVMGTGADPDLWFNFEARSADNCQNFKRVMDLGNNHHDIGYYCRNACPFFQSCKESGYLKQEETRKEKPITFFRHQHLLASMEQDYKSLVVIDEFAGAVLENNPIHFGIDDIYPHRSGWQLDIASFDLVEAVEQFAEAVRATMSVNAGAPMALPDGSSNPNYIISGAAFIKKLDEYCQAAAGQSLTSLVERIDSETLHKAYQPNFLGGQDDVVHLRCLPQFFDVVVRELADYEHDPTHRYPSCIHCVAGRLEIYAPERVKTRHRTPMVIADATGISTLYQAMFQRQIQTFAPQIQNPNARTEVIVHNDWTKGTMEKQIGAALRDRKQLVASAITSLEGEEFDPASIPVSENLYQSAMVQNAISIVKTLADRHSSLLVVTHKDLREVLESHTQALFPQSPPTAGIVDKIAWAHYGAVRGTNRYENFEAVALLGCFRIPYNIIWRRVQMWAWMLGIKEYIAPDTTKIVSQYDTDTFAETEHRSFLHSFAQAYVDMIEKGELQQCAARIRPHSTTKEKFVYCFANRPALQFINHLTPHRDFMRTTEDDAYFELYDFMKKEYKKQGKFPSYRSIKTEWHVGASTVKRIRDQIEKEKSA